MQKIISNGNRAVVIIKQGDVIWANLYINARNGIEGADISLIRWKGKTMKAAEAWANKVLNS